MGSLAGNPSLVNHTRSHQRSVLLFAYKFCSNTSNSLAEVCIGVICSCMPLLPGTIRHHASHIATIQSLLSSPVKYFYFSNRRSRSVSSTEPKPLILYPSKDKSEYSELGIGMVKCGGDRNRSLEGLQQYEVESQGTNTLPAFVGEEDRIHLKQEVTIIRQ